MFDDSDRVFDWYGRKTLNLFRCHINYVSVYARASARLLLAGHDVQAKIQRGKETLAARKLGGAFLDLGSMRRCFLLDRGALIEWRGSKIHLRR